MHQLSKFEKAQPSPKLSWTHGSTRAEFDGLDEFIAAVGGPLFCSPNGEDWGEQSGLIFLYFLSMVYIL